MRLRSATRNAVEIREMRLRSGKRKIHQDDESDSEIVDAKKSRSDELPKIKTEKLNPRTRYYHYNCGYSNSDDSEAEENNKRRNNSRGKSKKVKRSKRLKWHYDEFNVRVCDDVLTDLFSLGKRTELAKLETEGVRFNRLVQNRFSEAPFLVFDMKCARELHEVDKTSGKREQYVVCLTPPIKKPLSRILFAPDAVFTVPRFMRFRKALIQHYPYQKTSLRDWFDARTPLLRKFAPTLVGCKVTFKIQGSVGEHFFKSKYRESEIASREHSEKVTFIRQIIPEYFAQCGLYKFDSAISIYSWIENRYAGVQIDSVALLVPEPVQRCARLEIKHHNQRSFGCGGALAWFRQHGDSFVPCVQTLPIEGISNWLNHPLTKDAPFGQNRLAMGERHLTISMDLFENFEELIDTLKKDFQTSRKGGQPFSLNIKISHQKKKTDVVAEKLVNKKTNEQLSINCEEMGKEGRIALITIKRAKI